MPVDYPSERIKILEMIEAGEISASDGIKLLEALTGNPPLPEGSDRGPVRSEDFVSEPGEEIPDPSGTVESEPEIDVLDAPDLSADPGPALDAGSWRGWWKYVFWTGVAVMMLGALLLLLAAQYSAAGFWYFCAGIPFALGLLILLLGVYSRTSRWIHIRIKQPPGEFPSKIALSFPIPIRPTVWLIKITRRWVPQFDATGLDELILALGESASPQNPLYVQIQDDEDGEQVEVYIG